MWPADSSSLRLSSAGADRPKRELDNLLKRSRTRMAYHLFACSTSRRISSHSCTLSGSTSGTILGHVSAPLRSHPARPFPICGDDECAFHCAAGSEHTNESEKKNPWIRQVESTSKTLHDVFLTTTQYRYLFNAPNYHVRAQIGKRTPEHDRLVGSLQPSHPCRITTSCHYIMPHSQTMPEYIAPARLLSRRLKTICSFRKTNRLC